MSGFHDWRAIFERSEGCAILVTYLGGEPFRILEEIPGEFGRLRRFATGVIGFPRATNPILLCRLTQSSNPVASPGRSALNANEQLLRTTGCHLY